MGLVIGTRMQSVLEADALAHVAGYVLANDVSDEHALVTQRFLDAGLVIFAMTNTPEFGAKGVTVVGAVCFPHSAHVNVENACNFYLIIIV